MYIKCKKKINVMRCVTGLKWGTDVETLKYTYVDLFQRTDATGAAAAPSHCVKIPVRTTNYFSVYAVELYALLVAFQWAEQRRSHEVLICSDSIAALTSI